MHSRSPLSFAGGDYSICPVGITHNTHSLCAANMKISKSMDGEREQNAATSAPGSVKCSKYRRHRSQLSPVHPSKTHPAGIRRCYRTLWIITPPARAPASCTLSPGYIRYHASRALKCTPYHGVSCVDYGIYCSTLYINQTCTCSSHLFRPDRVMRVGLAFRHFDAC